MTKKNLIGLLLWVNAPPRLSQRIEFRVADESTIERETWLWRLLVRELAANRLRFRLKPAYVVRSTENLSILADNLREKK